MMDNRSVPSKRQEFLRNDSKKTGLSEVHAEDIELIIHVADAVSNGCESVMLHSVSRDLVVLPVSVGHT